MTEATPHTPIVGKEVLLKDATKEQLKAFAIELGCNVQNFHTEERLRELIYGKGWDKPFILVEAEEGAPLMPASAPLQPGAVAEPMVQIRLHQGEKEGGKRAVYVGVNGVGILIPRNVTCAIKHRYWAALTNAVERQYDLDERTQDIEPKDVPSYPFDVIRMPPESELQAWSDYKARLQAEEVARKRAA